MKNKSVGFKNISVYRKKKNLTQQELSELSGISLRTIQRIEKGEVEPRSFTIRKLQDILDTDFGQENEKEDLAGKLKVFSFIQITSFFLPVVFVFIGYLYWKRNKWNEKNNSIFNKLVSLSVILSVLIPILVLIVMAALRNYNVQVSYGNIPLALLLYWGFCFIYVLIMNKLSLSTLKGKSSNLPGLPAIFR